MCKAQPTIGRRGGGLGMALRHGCFRNKESRDQSVGHKRKYIYFPACFSLKNF
jgi:hypothetical protein